jgi:hypothetical protein
VIVVVTAADAALTPNPTRVQAATAATDSGIQPREHAALEELTRIGFPFRYREGERLSDIDACRRTLVSSDLWVKVSVTGGNGTPNPKR